MEAFTICRTVGQRGAVFIALRLRAAPPGVEVTAAAPPPAPACIVPKLAGETLARAGAALTAAGCKLGAVRKREETEESSPLTVAASERETAALRVGVML